MNEKELIKALDTEKSKIVKSGQDDHSAITDLIVEYLEDKFSFRPGFSNFEEIVVDYLCSGVTDIDTLTFRSKFSLAEARLVRRELDRFYLYSSDCLPDRH